MAIQEAIENRARAGLTDFSQYVDPAQKKWYRAKHLRKIAGVLEQVQRREITRVIFNLPPRHWKTSIVLKWEAKVLGDNPKEKIINASRAQELANKFSKQVRRTLQDARYQRLYPNTRIERGSDRADDWLLEGGYSSSYRAVGKGAGVAGEGASVLVLEDVSDPNQQASLTETANDWDWYKNVARTRLDVGGVIVIVNNRTGVNDLTGYILDPERNDSADPPHVWTVVNIPALDIDTGEYIWEERFGREWYLAYQNDPTLWRVQYQQKPTIAEGNLIKREWFEYVDSLPAGAKWQVRAWDIAFTEKQTEKHDPDFTATVAGCKHNNVLYLGNPRLFRKGIDAIATDIVTSKYEELSVRYGMGRVAIKSSIIKAMKGLAITEYEEHTDKIARASAWMNWASTGRVILVGDKKDWEAFMAQWTAFPSGHDDAVDAVSGVSQMLNLVISAPTPQKPSKPMFHNEMSMFG